MDDNGEDIKVSRWWTFYHLFGRGAPVSVRLDRIVAVTGNDRSSALIVEGREEPIEVEEDAQYVRDIVNAYEVFREDGVCV